MTRAQLDEESPRWLAELRGSEPVRGEAHSRLHAMLVRIARAEAFRRRGSLPGDIAADLDDLCVQAANDAMTAILRKLDQFRGASRFTTWAYKFVILEVSVRLRRRAWSARRVVLGDASWESLADPAPGVEHSLELARQMRRNLHFFWPRAESHLYEEPKKLVSHGLAAAAETFVGGRRRRTYSITAKGRRALTRWHRQECSAPWLEFEALARVFFGATARPEDLVRAVGTARALADEIQARGRVVGEEYLSGIAPVPERIHCSGLVFDFLWSHAENLRRWALAAESELALWKDTRVDSEKETRAKQRFEQALGRREEAARVSASVRKRQKAG